VTLHNVKKQALYFLSFIAVVVAVVGMLKILDWVPGVLEPGLMKKYPSVEAAQSSLGIRTIVVPTYFPQALGWPPAEVLAQSEPFPAVIMTFNRAGSGDPLLVISEAASPHFEPDVTIRFARIDETVPLDLSGRQATLEAGLCPDHAACSRIRWDEHGMRITLTMKAPSPDLLRIARSMLH